ncbi:MAG TPA: recombinase family protein [Ktedonobacterales bacterium]|jgi:hypothetical protein|nr:recombinase family protein [Ktedonobacterales bacterium]
MIVDVRGQLPRHRTASRVWRHATVGRILTNPIYMGERGRAVRRGTDAAA